VLIDPDFNSGFGNEIVGTFSGQVPSEGDRLDHTPLRQPDNSGLAGLPRYQQTSYVVTKVRWALTDEGNHMRAAVYVARLEDIKRKRDL